MDLTEKELQMLKDCKNSKEWNECCYKIKALRNGNYPDDWFAKVLGSGLMREITEGFTSESKTAF